MPQRFQSKSKSIRNPNTDGACRTCLSNPTVSRLITRRMRSAPGANCWRCTRQRWRSRFLLRFESSPDPDAVLRFDEELVAFLDAEGGIPRIHIALGNRAACRVGCVFVRENLVPQRVFALD